MAEKNWMSIGLDCVDAINSGGGGRVFIWELCFFA
jgi:hypothetical protein